MLFMTFCDSIPIHINFISAFRIPETVHLTISLSANKKEPAFAGSFGGEGGIRTLEGVTLTGFRDLLFQPLTHLSKQFLYYTYF